MMIFSPGIHPFVFSKHYEETVTTTNRLDLFLESHPFHPTYAIKVIGLEIEYLGNRQFLIPKIKYYYDNNSVVSLPFDQQLK